LPGERRDRSRRFGDEASLSVNLTLGVGRVEWVRDGADIASARASWPYARCVDDDLASEEITEAPPMNVRCGHGGGGWAGLDWRSLS